MKIANIIDQIVSRGLCLGCGACAVICPHGFLGVSWCHERGLPQAGYRNGSVCCHEKCGACLRVCPFHVQAGQSETISDILFARHEGIGCHHEAGYWLKSFVGYAPEQKIRVEAASGGLVTHVLQQLLTAGLITAAVCVERKPDFETAGRSLFSYRICRDADTIASCARSAYYPVGMEAVLREVMATPGRYAFVVLPCMATSLRLACSMNPVLKARIVFVVGLVCGQVKTAHFSEFLAAASGFTAIREVDFRVKAPEYPNSNFGVRIVGNAGTEKLVNFRSFSRIWSDRYFTPLPCNHCTDVFAETADAAFMDAWTPGLQEDWQGWSYAVFRNPELLAFFEKLAGRLPQTVQPAELSAVIRSQEGVLVSKREDVYWRVKMGIRKGDCLFLRNPGKLREARFSRRWISECAYSLSKASIDNWAKFRFRKGRFYVSMCLPVMALELGRCVWRISRVIGLLKERVGSFNDEIHPGR